MLALKARYWIGLGVLASIGLLLLALGRPLVTGVKTALLLVTLFPGSPLPVVSYLTPPPMLEEVSYTRGDETIIADVYRPNDNKRHGAVLVTFGANPVGRRDPRLVNLAQGLSRLGYVVMIPESNNLTRNIVVPEEVDNLVAGFQYLLGREYVDDKKVGMAGFCLGASLVALAAADPRINEQVAFINLFGGYYDIFDLIQAATTETYTYGGQTVSWTPEAQTREIFVSNLMRALGDERELALLREALGSIGGDSEALASKLSSSAKAMYALVTNKDPNKVKELANALDPEVRANLFRLSPNTVLGGLKAKVFIMHDEDDAIIPSVESRKLAEALESRGRFHLNIFQMFKHMNPTTTLFDLVKAPAAYLPEFSRFFWHLYLIMSEM